MAYTVVRVKMGVWRDRFKEAETDSDFEVETYPGLDDYLSTMESRGWNVVSTSVATASNGAVSYFLATLHRPEG